MMTTSDGLRSALHDIRHGTLRDEWAGWLILADWLDEEPASVVRGEGLYGAADRIETRGVLAGLIRDEVAAEQERTRLAGGRRERSNLCVLLTTGGDMAGLLIDTIPVRWRPS